MHLRRPVVKMVVLPALTTNMTESQTDDQLSRDQAHLIHCLHNKNAQQQAHVWTSGHGAVLVDADGKEYLDVLSGLWNVVVGHGRRELGEAAARQMDRLGFASSYAGSTTGPAIELAERLAGICYPEIQRFFLTSGGAEANDSAFKTARYYWKLAGHPNKYKIIGREWGYHGTTMAAMSATGISSYWPMFEPRVPGFVHIASPYPYRFVGEQSGEKGDRHVRSQSGSAGSEQAAPSQSPFLPGNNLKDFYTPGQQAADLLEAKIISEGPETVAAFLGEPVQGAGGVIVPPDDYWPRIRQICDRHNVLLITDEVITGFGRTGDWFGLTRYGVAPDIVTFAKAITSGYFPMGGIGVNRNIAAAIDGASGGQTWMHAFTYSGHPVGCAVALANMDIIEREGLVARAGELGRYLLKQLRTLESHKHVGEVRGQGLMTAVELVADKSTKAEFPPAEQIGAKVHAATQQRGMFTRLRGDVYNIAPCFVTTETQLDRMVQILGESIEAVLGS